jgi:hypothetical protein
MTAPIPIISAVVFHHGVCGYLHFSVLSLPGGVGTTSTLTEDCFGVPASFFSVLSFGATRSTDFLNGGNNLENKEDKEFQKEAALSRRRRIQEEIRANNGDSFSGSKG